MSLEIRRAAPTGAYHRILVATNFTPISKRAFRKAAHLAADLGSELHLLHVHSAPGARSIFFISLEPHSRNAIMQRLDRRIQRRFADFLRGEELGQVPVRTAHREGRPCAEIIRYAAENQVDLIVVGERPESRIQHLLQHVVFESVGERVRREALCSVLTVR